MFLKLAYLRATQKKLAYIMLHCQASNKNVILTCQLMIYDIASPRYSSHFSTLKDNVLYMDWKDHVKRHRK